jgi:hypothetical protein
VRAALDARVTPFDSTSALLMRVREFTAHAHEPLRRRDARRIVWRAPHSRGRSASCAIA